MHHMISILDKDVNELFAILNDGPIGRALIKKVIDAKTEAVTFEKNDEKFLTIRACVFEMEGKVEVWYLGKASFASFIEKEFKDIPISVVSKRCNFKDMKYVEADEDFNILKIRFER